MEGLNQILQIVKLSSIIVQDVIRQICKVHPNKKMTQTNMGIQNEEKEWEIYDLHNFKQYVVTLDRKRKTKD